MEAVHVIVYVSREIWDEFFITATTFSSYSEHEYCVEVSDHFLCAYHLQNDTIGDNLERLCNCKLNVKSNYPPNDCTCNLSKLRIRGEKCVIFKQCCKVQMNGYLVSMFIRTLKLSEVYRWLVISNLMKYRNSAHNKNSYPCKLVVQLCAPEKDIIDYKWNDRMVTLALERREVDNAMSWLSTLGGAFSALGDQFDHCALVAGRISIQQLKLALRLGDPLTVSRCKLYLALSLLQRGYLKDAQKIIERQYAFARSSSVVDMRLIRMCQGIWAKLKYMYQIKKFRQNADLLLKHEAVR